LFKVAKDIILLCGTKQLSKLRVRGREDWFTHPLIHRVSRVPNKTANLLRIAFDHFDVKIAAEEAAQSRKDFSRIQNKLFIANHVMPWVSSTLKAFPERYIPSLNCILE
jgi:hypothetical protein